MEREHVTACPVLLPRRLIDRIELLDERFFYYYDDADLSLRVREAGLIRLMSVTGWGAAACCSFASMYGAGAG